MIRWIETCFHTRESDITHETHPTLLPLSLTDKFSLSRKLLHEFFICDEEIQAFIFNKFVNSQPAWTRKNKKLIGWYFCSREWKLKTNSDKIKLNARNYQTLTHMNTQKLSKTQLHKWPTRHDKFSPIKHPRKFIRTFTHQVGTEYSFKYQIGIMIGREVRKSGKIRFLLSIMSIIKSLRFIKNC